MSATALNRRLVVAGFGLALLPSTRAANGPVAPGWRMPPAGARVVIVPPTTTDDPVFAPGGPLLVEALHQRLFAAGYRTAQLDAANRDELWRQEVEAVGGVFDPVSGARRAEPYARALSRLGRRVAESAGAALVVVAEFAARDARMSGSRAEWDGQSRPIPVAGSAGSRFDLEGTVKALSVSLTGIDAGGLLAFRAVGGASLVYRVNATSRRMELRPDLFDDGREIAEAVRIALADLLPGA